MKFLTSSAAYFTGFRDGYNGVMNRPVPNFGREYEWGFMSGAMERKRISRVSYASFLATAAAPIRNITVAGA